MGHEKQERNAHIHIPVPLEVKHSKAAHIPQPINMHSKFPEEIRNSWRAIRQREPQHKGSEDNTQNLLHEDYRLHREELSKFRMDLD